MEMDISTVMSILFPAGTLLLALLLILAAVLHINNLNRVYKLMDELQHNKDYIKDCSRDSSKSGYKALLYKEMTVSQGINFTALALASWIMLFVAVAYLYLLVPTILPFSYMSIAELASNDFGFAIFGLIVAGLVAVIILFLDKLPEDHRELKLTELYSFYSISKGMKRMIGMTVVALCLSVLFSAYIGTIYPAHSLQAELFSLMILLMSAGILVMPVYKEAWEARR
jgi:hypothetical protein